MSDSLEEDILFNKIFEKIKCKKNRTRETNKKNLSKMKEQTTFKLCQYKKIQHNTSNLSYLHIQRSITC